MPQRKKKIVWHKKKNKFIPSSAIKSHSPDKKDSQDFSSKKKDKQRAFAEKLSAQIKKAVRDK